MERKIVQSLESRIWEAAKKWDGLEFAGYLHESAIMVSNNYCCSGQEYIIHLEELGLVRYRIEHYETICYTKSRIQNFYYVNFKKNKWKTSKYCYATSTWELTEDGWKLRFHMHTPVESI